MSDDFWGEPISVYSRKESIEDGVLIDISETARLHGFKFPVAMTCGSLAEIGDDNIEIMLELFKSAIKNHKADTDRIDVVCLGTHMYAVIGPGDTPEPVITIMLNGED
jgi:type I site-specific restriction endonuclease